MEKKPFASTQEPIGEEDSIERRDFIEELVWRLHSINKERRTQFILQFKVVKWTSLQHKIKDKSMWHH
jgi:hypothetical protein